MLYNDIDLNSNKCNTLKPIGSFFDTHLSTPTQREYLFKIPANLTQMEQMNEINAFFNYCAKCLKEGSLSIVTDKVTENDGRVVSQYNVNIVVVGDLANHKQPALADGEIPLADLTSDDNGNLYIALNPEVVK